MVRIVKNYACSRNTIFEQHFVIKILLKQSPANCTISIQSGIHIRYDFDQRSQYTEATYISTDNILRGIEMHLHAD